ncbi:hypothetical protein BKA70DRAFT_360968 [Coprinopsis sp. MPI-PUGE-AT-0042]|nr:hypothetical protein BKA70DRAFT_360968 [Coprinopsis sp. MPI-PUGE-AT-0042]
MPATLSAELYSRIVDCVVPRRGDLARLCMVCKAFQREAEARLYGQVGLPDPRRTFIFNHAIIANERYGLYTKIFWFHPPFPNGRDPLPILPNPFWEAMQAALAKMPNLKSLTALDHAKDNGWVFDPPQPFAFQLREARLRLKWDEHLIHFLRTQPSLASLQLIDFPEPHTEETCQLPNLVTFEGSLAAGAQFFEASPLKNMHLSVHKDSLPLLATLPSTVRGLTLLEVPEEMAMSTLDLVTSRCPNLVHLGQFHFPVLKHHKFIKLLMRLPDIRSVEIDITHWMPTPILSAQRALASELKTFNPTLRLVFFWINHNKIRWLWNETKETWVSKVESNVHRAHGQHWCAGALI